MLNELCEANVPAHRINQLSGHKRVDSIEDYHKNASLKHQEEMSRILSNSSNSATDTGVITNTAQSKVDMQSSNAASSSSCSQPQQMHLFGANTTITGGNFTINFVKATINPAVQEENLKSSSDY